MLQVLYVCGIDMPDLIESLNKTLSGLNSKEKPNIIYNRDKVEAIVEYEPVEVYENSLCCECQYFDTSGSASDVSGLCQLKGKRCRFNCRACKDYKDIRL